MRASGRAQADRRRPQGRVVLLRAGGEEYEGKRKSLVDALDQLKRYALALENPPLLVVSDLDRFRIVTNWTNTVSYKYEFDLDGLREAKTASG